MKKYVNALLLMLVLLACSNDVSKEFAGKRWFVYSVGISFLNADGSEGEPNTVYYNKQRAAATLWQFTQTGEYSVVEGSDVESGTWNMKSKSVLQLVAQPGKSVRAFDILKASENDFILKLKSMDGNNPLASVTIHLKANIANWPSNEEIDRQNINHSNL